MALRVALRAAVIVRRAVWLQIVALLSVLTLSMFAVAAQDRPISREEIEAILVPLGQERFAINQRLLEFRSHLNARRKGPYETEEEFFNGLVREYDEYANRLLGAASSALKREARYVVELKVLEIRYMADTEDVKLKAEAIRTYLQGQHGQGMAIDNSPFTESTRDSLDQTMTFLGIDSPRRPGYSIRVPRDVARKLDIVASKGQLTVTIARSPAMLVKRNAEFRGAQSVRPFYELATPHLQAVSADWRVGDTVLWAWKKN